MYTKNVNIRIGEVWDINDPEKCGRIKVKVGRYDTKEEDTNWCYPLLPQIMHILPKKGETVIVLLAEANNTSSTKYYIGPIISQPHKMNEDLYYGDARKIFNDGGKLDNPNYEVGTFCEDSDIALYGRKGCEVILKENDIRIQSGVRVGSKDNFKEGFNEISPSYLKLKYYPTDQIFNNKHFNNSNDVYNSTATLVADEISLISNKSGRLFKDKNGRNDLLSDEVIKKILEESHPMVYGDVLIEYLHFLNEKFLEHTHHIDNNPPVLSNNGREKLLSYDFNKILSKHIKLE